MPPTTVVHARTQPKYSKRFHHAYGHHRSRAGAPIRTFGTKSPEPPTDTPPDAALLLTMTSLAATTLARHRPAARPTSFIRCTLVSASHAPTNPLIPGGSPNRCPASEPTPTACDNDACRRATVYPKTPAPPSRKDPDDQLIQPAHAKLLSPNLSMPFIADTKHCHFYDRPHASDNAHTTLGNRMLPVTTLHKELRSKLPHSSMLTSHARAKYQPRLTTAHAHCCSRTGPPCSYADKETTSAFHLSNTLTSIFTQSDVLNRYDHRSIAPSDNWFEQSTTKHQVCRARTQLLFMHCT